MHDTTQPAYPRYAVDIDQYVILSTSLSVFLWQVLYAGVINFYLGYVVVIANSAILLLCGQLVIHRFHLYFLVALALVSTLAATITHNPVRAMVAQITGISVFSIYYYSVFFNTKFSLDRILRTYVGWANVAAIWGYPIWIFHKAQNHSSYRFHSWFAEPSHYVYATLPAVSLILLRWYREKRFNYASLPLLFSYVLADSSTAYVGIGITILLMADFRSIRRTLLMVILCAASACFVYSMSASLRLRINDTLQSEIKTEATNTLREAKSVDDPSFGANATTFALITNAYVAWRAFQSSPAIGTGLGTHTVSYEKYAPEIVSPTFLMFGLNRDDANSLFLRLASETGLAGVTSVFFLIFYFGRVKGTNAQVIRNAMLPYFAMRLIRFGAYFSLENFFFIMIYGFNFLEHRRALQPVDAPPPTPGDPIIRPYPQEQP